MDVNQLLYNPLSPEFRMNPYPFLHQLRQQDPVHYSPLFKSWLISRYQDAMKVLKSEHFNVQTHQNAEKSKMINLMQCWLASMNPPHHTILRRMINKEFSSQKLNNLRPFVLHYATELVNKLKNREVFDFVNEFVYPFSVAVISRLIGIPIEDCDKVLRWNSAIFPIMESVFRKTISNEQHVLDEATEYIESLIVQRKTKPQNDVLSYLITQREVELSRMDIVANCLLFLLGGLETTVNSIGNGMRALLQHPKEYEKLKLNPGLLENCVEEMLRYDPAVQRISRYALKNFELDNKSINVNDNVLILIGAVNRDPAQFPDPDRFDIERKPNKNLAFGMGHHFCIGTYLARLENQITFELFLEQFDQLILEDREIKYRASISFRALESLRLKQD